MKKEKQDPDVHSEPGEELPPSKSQRKRDALRTIELAKALIDLPVSRRNRLALPQEIDEALRVADNIRSNGARKRQLQFIGKLLRSGPDYEAIRQSFENQGMPELPAAGAKKESKSQDLQMRERLLADLSGTMSELQTAYPNANIQLIRQLVTRVNKSSTKISADDCDDARNKSLQAISEALAAGRIL